MTCKQLFSIGLMAISLIATGPGQGVAATDKANLWVSATVTPWFKAQAIQQINSYQVTREDIERGYTDLAAALSIQFQTNILQGKILLQILSNGTEQVLVKQAGTVSDQLFIALLSSNPQARQTYDLRIVLTPEIVTGTYPLHLSMQTTVL